MSIDTNTSAAITSDDLPANRYFSQPLPRDRVPGRGHARGRRLRADPPGAAHRRAAVDEPGVVRDDVDGAGGREAHQRGPVDQPHRPRGIPDRRARRADLRADAGRPVERPRRRPGRRRGHRSARPRRSCSACWPTSSAGASGARRPGCRPTGPTSSSAPRPTSCGTSSPATSTSSCRKIPMRSDRFVLHARRRRRRRSTRTPSPWAPCWARPSSGRTTPSRSSTTSSCGSRPSKGWDIPLHVDGASGGFIAPFAHPDERWDFRLEQVASINASGHKYGLVYPGVGWLVFRDRDFLSEDLVFSVNYLGGAQPTFTFNFSRGSAMIQAQLYNFVRLGRAGYTADRRQHAGQRPLPQRAAGEDGPLRDPQPRPVRAGGDVPAARRRRASTPTTCRTGCA